MTERYKRMVRIANRLHTSPETVADAVQISVGETRKTCDLRPGPDGGLTVDETIATVERLCSISTGNARRWIAKHRSRRFAK